MAHFAYSLFLSLMHSFWQAALLLCIYSITNLLIRKNNPLNKRNLLFLMLVAQFFISVSTFFTYYSGNAFYYFELIDANLSGLLVNQPYIESIAPWLTGFYIVILVYKTLKLIFNWQQFIYSSKAAWIKPPIDQKLFTKVKAFEFGIRRNVKLWYSNGINTPLTFGFIKPVILLPVALVNNLSVAETETLIIHELTHIKSNDYLLNWLLIICENIFFFNPFIRIISERIKLEREKNCDTRVLQFNYPSLIYAETLLKTARLNASAPSFLLAAVLNKTQLAKRILFFTDEKNLQVRKKNYSGFTIVPVMVMFVLNIFLLNFLKTNKPLPIIQAQNTNNIKTGIKENMPDLINSAAIFTGNNENQSTTGITVPKATLHAAEVEKASVIAESEEQEVVKDESVSNNMIMPVALEEQQKTRQVIIKDEFSTTGRSVTRVYQMRFVNGEWKATLMWTISETRPASDSLPYLGDTTTRFYNQSQ